VLTWAQEGPEHCVLRSVAATLLGPKGWLLQVPAVVLACYVVESPVGGLAWKGPWSFDVCGVDCTFRFAIFLFWWIAWLVPTRYWLLLCLLQGPGAPRMHMCTSADFILCQCRKAWLWRPLQRKVLMLLNIPKERRVPR
jgi:hypothetical protein